MTRDSYDDPEQPHAREPDIEIPQGLAVPELLTCLISNAQLATIYYDIADAPGAAFHAILQMLESNILEIRTRVDTHPTSTGSRRPAHHDRDAVQLLSSHPRPACDVGCDPKQGASARAALGDGDTHQERQSTCAGT